MNLAVLQLREYGELIKLQHKWWVAKGQCGGSKGVSVGIFIILFRYNLRNRIGK